MNRIMLIHPLILWPCTAIISIFTGVLNAGYRDYALNSERVSGEVRAIIKYIDKPEKQIQALGDIKI